MWCTVYSVHTSTALHRLYVCTHRSAVLYMHTATGVYHMYSSACTVNAAHITHLQWQTVIHTNCTLFMQLSIFSLMSDDINKTNPSHMFWQHIAAIFRVVSYLQLEAVTVYTITVTQLTVQLGTYPVA